MKKNKVYFLILTLIFALCCVFNLKSNTFKGVEVKATTNEILENEEQVEQETTEDDVNELVEDLTLEVKDFILWVVGILSALGVSWGSIATIIKFIKNKVKDANQDLSTTFEEMEKIKEKLKENNITLERAKEQLKQVYDELETVKELLKEFYDSTKLKQLAINKAVSNVLIETEEKKEDDLKDESI